MKTNLMCPGLEIISDIVKQFNGFIGFKTMKNVGTCFSFSIPLSMPIEGIIKDQQEYEQIEKSESKEQLSCEVDNDLTLDE